MQEPQRKSLTDLGTINLQNASEADLNQLKTMSDDDLLRASTTIDLFSGVESMRRLRIALHREETAIKWLTFVLVILTLILVWIGIRALPH